MIQSTAGRIPLDDTKSRGHVRFVIQSLVVTLAYLTLWCLWHGPDLMAFMLCAGAMLLFAAVGLLTAVAIGYRLFYSRIRAPTQRSLWVRLVAGALAGLLSVQVGARFDDSLTGLVLGVPITFYTICLVGAIQTFARIVTHLRRELSA